MKHLLLSIFISLLFLITLFNPALAAPLDISIYPPITEIIATPNSIVKAPLSITNHTNEIQNLELNIRPFQGTTEDGTIIFSDETIESIKSMLRFEKNGELFTDEITLRPIETAHLELTVATAEDTNASNRLGDYYFVVLFQTKHQREIEQSASRIQASMGSIVLLSVRNPARLDDPIVRLKEFSTQRVFTGEPIAFSLRIENQSSHFVKTKGEIIVSDINGNEVKKITLPSQNVLSSSTRNLTYQIAPIDSQKLFGKYTAEAFITIGEDNVLYQRIIFYVIPKKIGIISLIILIGSITLVMRLRSYNRSLFSKKQKTSSRIPRRKSKKKMNISK